MGPTPKYALKKQIQDNLIIKSKAKYKYPKAMARKIGRSYLLMYKNNLPNGRLKYAGWTAVAPKSFEI